MSDINVILRRAAQELQDGDVVNLGIGLPSQVVNHIPAQTQVLIHSENGVLGVADQPAITQIDPFLIDSAGSYVSTKPGASFFDSSVSFALIRRGKLDLTMIGAFEVDQLGNLANWKIPGKFSPGIGGAMELAQKTPRVVVLTTHCDKHGRPKIVEHCSLPLTAKHCVSRIITEKAVFDVSAAGLVLCEKLDTISLAQLRDITGATFSIAEEVKSLCP